MNLMAVLIISSLIIIGNSIAFGGQRRDLFKPLLEEKREINQIVVDAVEGTVNIEGKLLKQGQQKAGVFFIDKRKDEILLRIEGILCRIKLLSNKCKEKLIEGDEGKKKTKKVEKR